MNSNSTLGNLAVVTGAGIAGLFAAAALSGYFKEVVILERDALPAQPDNRIGVPQGPQGHQLLKRGENLAEQFFPGFRQALRDTGAVELDVDRDFSRYVASTKGASPGAKATLFSQSRPLLEQVLRNCVLQRHNVSLRDNSRCRDYLVKDRKIVGVVVQGKEGDTEELYADLVVDATGRGSRLPAWLQANDFGAVDTGSLEIDVSYVSGIFTADNLDDGEAQMCVVAPLPPDIRGGGTLPIEGKRWLIAMHSRGEEVPVDMEGFLAFAKSLPVPYIYNRVCNSRLEGRLSRFKIHKAYRHYYERLPVFPQGLIPLGDTLVGFNPIQGQGMSIAAMEAEILQNVLGERVAKGEGLQGLDRDYFAAIEPVLDEVWNAATGFDLFFDTTKGERPDNFAEQRQGFMAMQAMVEANDQLRHRRFLVENLLAPASSLLAAGDGV